MTLFKKTETRPVGPSFPFMTESQKDIRIKYDSVEVEFDNDQVSMVFYQGDFPIYAYSCSPGITQGSIRFSDLDGTVKLRKVV